MRKGAIIFGIMIWIMGMLLGYSVANYNVNVNINLGEQFPGDPFVLMWTTPNFLMGAIFGTLFIACGARGPKTVVPVGQSPGQPQIIIHQAPAGPVREIIKEIIKVKCTFCGTLVDHLLSECPNCGGKMN